MKWSDDMYAYCNEMPGITEEMAAKVDAEVGEAPVAGLIAHVAGPTEIGWRIIDVWESEADYKRFQVERLNPALQIATRGAPAPRLPFESFVVTGIPRLDRRS
jgi:hypothetical protein